jgi:hypothetical protein
VISDLSLKSKLRLQNNQRKFLDLNVLDFWR